MTYVGHLVQPVQGCAAFTCPISVAVDVNAHAVAPGAHGTVDILGVVSTRYTLNGAGPLAELLAELQAFGSLALLRVIPSDPTA